MRFLGATLPTFISAYPVSLSEPPFPLKAQYVVRNLKLNAEE